MWIKTMEGVLLNLDMFQDIRYNPTTNKTSVNGGYYVLAEGDYRDEIARNFQRGSKYMEVK